MLDLLKKNKEMLSNKSYKVSDERDMLRISTLENPNDYDLYLIACCLCNYDIDEKAEARDLRMKYYQLTNNGSSEGFEHPLSDYGNATTDITCVNTKKVNKYGLYEYEINLNDRGLVSDLWDAKTRDCLKYVDSKTFKDKVIVSISKNQLDKFINLLDTLMIQYNIDDITSNISHNNKSNNTLIDFSFLNFPFEPYDFQIEDAKKIVTMKRALLGHDMGCGKTFIAILIGSSLNLPKLVICPESLRLNWKKEILSICPTADVHILLKNESFHMGEDWTIIGYSTLVKFLDELKDVFDCIFVDECHAFKAVNNWGQPTSKRAKALLNLADKVTYCYLLSGTPLPSHNIDLFNILKMLKCEEFDFNSKWAFLNYAKKYCDPKETAYGKDFSGSSNTDQLHAALNKLMIRRLKKEVLPDLVKQRQFIPIEPKLKRDYINLEKRLHKPASGESYMGLAMTGRKMLSMYKVDTAIELAESILDADQSVVLVTCFNETADYLRDHFKNTGCEIRGGMSDTEKNQAIEDFQNKKKTVCVLNMQAGGVGVTLTAAHTMIIIDYAWVPSDMVQVEDRIYRLGQEDCCIIYYIYCVNSILDDTFVKMISSKSANIDTVVDNSDNTFDLQNELMEHSTFLDILKERLNRDLSA